MTLDVEKGGRGKKAPYESTHCRIPTAIKPLVEKIGLIYKSVAGQPHQEQEALKIVEDAIARAWYPVESHKDKYETVNEASSPSGEEVGKDKKPVNGFKTNAEVGTELVKEYLQSLGLDEMPVDEKGKPKARYDQLAKFTSWLESKQD